MTLSPGGGGATGQPERREANARGLHCPPGEQVAEPIEALPVTELDRLVFFPRRLDRTQQQRVVFAVCSLGLLAVVLFFALRRTDTTVAVLCAVAAVVLFALAGVLYVVGRRPSRRVEVDDAGVTLVQPSRGTVTLRWDEVSDIKELRAGVELRSSRGDKQIRIPFVGQFGTSAEDRQVSRAMAHYMQSLEDVAYAQFAAMRERAAGAPRLPVMFRTRASFEVWLWLFTLLAFGVPYAWLWVSAGDWPVVVLAAPLFAVYSKLVLRHCPYSVTAREDGFVVRYVWRAPRIVAFGQVVDMGVAPDEVTVYLHEGSVGLPPAKEGLLAGYHVLRSAWEAWKASSKPPEDASPADGRSPLWGIHDEGTELLHVRYRRLRLAGEAGAPDPGVILTYKGGGIVETTPLGGGQRQREDSGAGATGDIR